MQQGDLGSPAASRVAEVVTGCAARSGREMLRRALLWHGPRNRTAPPNDDGRPKRSARRTPLAGASGCSRQGVTSRLALHRTDALALVLELREVLPAVVLALVLAGGCDRRRLAQRGGAGLEH